MQFRLSAHDFLLEEKTRSQGTADAGSRAMGLSIHSLAVELVFDTQVAAEEEEQNCFKG
jgi:hypothetical protein